MTKMNIVYGVGKRTSATNTSARHIDDGTGKPLCQHKTKTGRGFGSSYVQDFDEPTCKRCLKLAAAQTDTVQPAPQPVEPTEDELNRAARANMDELYASPIWKYYETYVFDNLSGVSPFGTWMSRRIAKLETELAALSRAQDTTATRLIQDRLLIAETFGLDRDDVLQDDMEDTLATIKAQLAAANARAEKAESRVKELEAATQEVIALAQRGQGDWLGVGQVYAPIWAWEYKSIVDILTNGQGDYPPAEFPKVVALQSRLKAFQAAAQDALDWINRFSADAPIMFGGEAAIAGALAKALKGTDE